MNSETSLPKEDPAAPTVVLGIGGGIAAYKVANVVRALRKAGVRIFVIPTRASENFVGPATWQELSENPVSTEIFSDSSVPGHIELASIADLIVVAPTTADLLAKFRAGLAADLLSTVFLASDAPKVLFPAMHTGMWENPATVENVAVLRQRGIHVFDPESGALSSGDSGKGRLPEPETITREILTYLGATSGDLAGRRVLITAGGTIEPLDPVRYLGNHSTGRQGIDLALAARRRGADVTLVVGQVGVELPAPSEHLHLVSVASASEMAQAVADQLPETDILIMAAAVADYRPRQVAEGKLKKESWGANPTIELVENPDILRSVASSAHRPPVLIGFGAETGGEEEVIEKGARKARAKGADLLAVNRVGDGRGFGDVDNELLLMDPQGQIVARLAGTKSELADQLLSQAIAVKGLK